MARPRLELQELFKTLTSHVYFQPPAGNAISYPCIIYSLSDVVTKRGDNSIYNKMKQYTVTVIDRDPDSQIPDSVLDLPYCTYDRRYTADGLNHNVFTLHF